jgi:hypothetical protein
MLAAKKRKRRRRRNRGATAENGIDGRNESPGQSLPRIDLGIAPVPINRMRILQEANRVKTETSPFHLGSTSVFLLGHRSDKSFSPETNRPEPEAADGLAAKKRKRRKHRNRILSQRPRSADTEEAGDGRRNEEEGWGIGYP